MNEHEVLLKESILTGQSFSSKEEATIMAGAAAPQNAVIIQFTMFMNDPSLKKLISDLAEGNEITSS